VLLLAVALNSLGVLAAFLSSTLVAGLFLLAGITFAVHALGLFELPERLPKVRGAHSSFPSFVRIAYGWALVAAGLGIWAASVVRPQGIWGASRHALTAGFMATMVFAIGQRVLPAFTGRAFFGHNPVWVVWKADFAVFKTEILPLALWFSKARERRDSAPQLNAERQNRKCLPGARHEPTRTAGGYFIAERPLIYLPMKAA
jgi:hypothetical protein